MWIRWCSATCARLGQVHAAQAHDLRPGAERCRPSERRPRTAALRATLTPERDRGRAVRMSRAISCIEANVSRRRTDSAPGAPRRRISATFRLLQKFPPRVVLQHDRPQPAEDGDSGPVRLAIVLDRRERPGDPGQHHPSEREHQRGAHGDEARSVPLRRAWRVRLGVEFGSALGPVRARARLRTLRRIDIHDFSIPTGLAASARPRRASRPAWDPGGVSTRTRSFARTSILPSANGALAMYGAMRSSLSGSSACATCMPWGEKPGGDQESKSE